MTGIILSAGKQSRWINNNEPKQLSVVYGQRLMDRHLAQFAGHYITPIVVAWRREIIDRALITWNTGGPTESLVHAILLTEPLWSNRTILLHGDTYVFDHMFNELMHDPLPLRFWMNESEIYAVTFTRDRHELLSYAARYVQSQDVPQEIRTIYRHLIGVPIAGAFKPVPTVLSGKFINSCTDMFDVDSPDQLAKYPAP